MSNSVRGARWWINAWLPAVLMTGIIVLESTQWFGADNTSGPLRYVYEALFGHVSDARWEAIHHYTRKCGHFTGYGLVGLSWLRAWRKTRSNHSFLNNAALAMIATALTAIADEFHQSFLPNRTSSPWDVLIDCSGALVAMLIVYSLAAGRRQTHSPKAA
jgi:VanZ family protein